MSNLNPETTTRIDCDAIEDAIVRVRCIGQILQMMGESMHSQDDPTGEAVVRLGQDLLIASEKLQPVIGDLMAYERLAKAKAA